MDKDTAGGLEPILITGANGLVGRATLARLNPTRKVYALVRETPNQPLPGGVAPIVHDLRRQRDPELPEIPGAIVHLAQSPRHHDFPNGALDVFEVNVGSTQRLLEWGCRHGVKRFIYASSGGVYGSGDAPLEEDALATAAPPIEHYLASKRCGELLVEAYSSYMTVIVLRFFFVYGPGQRRTMLIPRLLSRVTEGRPVMLQGENGIRINPIYVDDAAAAIEASTRLEASEMINVVGPQVLTVREIGELMGEATGCKPNFKIHLDAKPKHIVGSAEKMARMLGASKVTMAEGLKRMMASDSEVSV